MLPPGHEISFCGVDCHLHVSVREVRAGPDLGVTVHFTSNAKRAPEWPGSLRFRLRDGSVLIVTWDSGLDYLVPGAGNPLVQRQRRLALPTPAGA